MKLCAFDFVLVEKMGQYGRHLIYRTRASPEDGLEYQRMEWSIAQFCNAALSQVSI